MLIEIPLSLCNYYILQITTNGYQPTQPMLILITLFVSHIHLWFYPFNPAIFYKYPAILSIIPSVLP